MVRKLPIMLGIALVALGCGHGKGDPIPNYGRGKVYETRQATNVLSSTTWCDTVVESDGSQDIFTFHRNGSGRYAVWNGKTDQFTVDERMWWRLKGDVLTLHIADQFGPARTETLRFRSNAGATQVVFLEQKQTAEVILSKCDRKTPAHNQPEDQ